MAVDAYLDARETKKLAQGDMVKVRIDGEYKWIVGEQVVDQL